MRIKRWPNTSSRVDSFPRMKTYDRWVILFLILFAWALGHITYWTMLLLIVTALSMGPMRRHPRGPGGGSGFD